MNRRVAMILMTFALIPCVSGMSPSTDEHTFERSLMATRFAITCHHPDVALAKAAADEAFAAAEKINQVASDYIADSELLEASRHSAGESVHLSPLLFKLVSEAHGFARKTNGCFDPTLGPLTKLWRESRRRKTLPVPEVLASAREASGWKNIDVDSNTNTIKFQRPGMRLDLGGIAKGQAADVMLEIMKARGIPVSCITAGGDVRLGDAPPGEKGWKVSVKIHEGEASPTILVLANCAVSTSGDLHQFIEIDGVRYSHIVDPATGLGITRAVTATVIAPDATTSDAIATACCTAPEATARSLALAAGATEVYLSK